MSESNPTEWDRPYLQSFDDALALLRGVRADLPAVQQALALLDPEVRDNLHYLAQFDPRD